jgi:hypothetical protein
VVGGIALKVENSIETAGVPDGMEPSYFLKIRDVERAPYGAKVIAEYEAFLPSNPTSTHAIYPFGIPARLPAGS